MATTAGDQQRSTLVVAALVASALTIVAQRTIKAGRELGTRALPAADLQSLSPFLGPLTDTSVVGQGITRATVITRDPFAPTGVARSVTPLGTNIDAPRLTTEVGQRWVVSTIVFEGSKKSAIVNNAWVTVGDALGGGSRLTAVERDHIVVTDANGIRHKVPIQGGESW